MTGAGRTSSGVRIGTALAVFGIVAGAVALVTHAVGGRLDDIVDNFVLHTGSSAIVLGAIALAAVRRHPTNKGVWALLVAVAAQGLEMAGWAYTAFAAPDAGPAAFDAIVHGGAAPIDLPLDLAVAQWVAWSVWVIGLVGWMTFGFMWFPDGSLAGPRWRWLPALAAAGVVALTAAYAVGYRPASDIPYSAGEDGLTGGLQVVFGVGAVLSAAAILATVASLFARYRAAGPSTREGLKWMGFGAVVLALVMLVAFPFGAEVVAVAGLVGLPLLFVAYGIAILRHRAFDIDVVISRTLVFGSLAAFITAMYVGIVVGVGSLLDVGTEPSPALALVAITVVAISFQPLRRWLTRQANRLVFGRRSTPYEVLSDFSRRVAAADEQLLETVARSLVEGTPADAVTVWVEESDELHPAAAWPVDDRPSAAVPSDRVDDLPGATAAFPVYHQGDLMGAIGLSLPPGAELSPADVGLADQVAAAMGLALRNLGLTESLMHRVQELQESRRRIVKVRDETRRRLERDLHDGAQQRLVALRVRLGLVGRMVEKSGPDGLAAMVAEIADEAQGAIDTLRDFARGVYPPLLEAEGLGPALTARARRSPLPVEVEAAGVGRHGREVEAAVYFAVLEALQNVVKHAGATRARVEISDDGGAVRFSVSDDGRGMEGATEGSGMRNIRDRVDALGGNVSIGRSTAGGALVEGEVPSGTTAEVGA